MAADESSKTADDAPVRKESLGPWAMLWKRLLHNRVAVIGGSLLVVLYIATLFCGFISPYTYDDSNRDSAFAGPMLLGGFVHRATDVPSKVEPGKTVTVWERDWSWFEGGVHFHDSDGDFTLRPHVHPMIEKAYLDEYGDQSYSLAGSDTSVSVPVEFFVDALPPVSANGEVLPVEEHEVFSLFGLFPLKSTVHFFGVRHPEGHLGVTRIYLLGSDIQGRDLFSRLLYGGQISLSVGLVGVLISMSLGMLLGGVSGYYGGAVDFISQRIVEVILAVPGLYLIIVCGSVLTGWRKPDGSPLSSAETYFAIVIVLAFIGWASINRVIRGMVLSLKENDYVVAAQATGVPTFWIIVRHILPNTFSFAIVTATLYIPYYILGEVALSFLGLGIQEPLASWGNLLRAAQETAYLTKNPWIVVPGVFIFVAVLAYNFLGDGLRDAADPKAVISRAKRA